MIQVRHNRRHIYSYICVLALSTWRQILNLIIEFISARNQLLNYFLYNTIQTEILHVEVLLNFKDIRPRFFCQCELNNEPRQLNLHLPLPTVNIINIPENISSQLIAWFIQLVSIMLSTYQLIDLQLSCRDFHNTLSPCCNSLVCWNQPDVSSVIFFTKWKF